MLHITLLPNPLPPWVKITAFSNIFISEDGFLGNGLSSPPVRNSCWLVAFPRPYKTSLCKQRKSSLKWWAVLLVNGQTTMTLAHRMVEGFFLSLFPECLSSFLIIFCLSLLFRSSLLLPSFFPFFFFTWNEGLWRQWPQYQGRWMPRWMAATKTSLPCWNLTLYHTGWTFQTIHAYISEHTCGALKHVCLCVPLLA